MTHKCFVCKNDIESENYCLYELSSKTKHPLTIGIEDPKKQGLCIVVCKNCLYDMVADQLKEMVERM